MTLMRQTRRTPLTIRKGKTMNMTNRGEGWGDTDSGVARPTGQVLPITREDACPIDSWEYLALARVFRKWKRANGHGDAMPIDAYARWCKHVGIPCDECEGMLHLPGYSIY